MENYIVCGPTNEPNLNPVGGDLNLMIYRHLKDRGNKVALINAVTDSRYTFSDIFSSSCLLAKNLIAKGVESGDVLSICCENRMEQSLCIPAALYIGAVLAPVNPLYTKGELIHCFNILKPKFVLCSEVTLKTMCTVVENCKFITELILFSSSTPNVKCSIKITLFTDLLKPLHPIEDHGSFIPVKCNPYKQTAIVLFSSGTTGLPKGVKLSHANINTFIRTSRSKSGFNFNETNTVLGLVPFYHGYGHCQLMWMLSIGLQLVFIPRFNEIIFLSTIEKYKITFLPTVPPLMLLLAKSPLIDQYDLSSVKEMMCGAAPCGLNLIHQVLSRLGVKSFKQGYGMTELSLVLVVTPHGSDKYESVGKPVIDAQAKVVDLETGEPLGPNATGELYFRGPQVMQGYYNNEKATRETIDSDGWLHTGDIGYYDKEGFIYIVDRIKELIKYNGYQVAPAELEALLLSHSGIKDAAVIGIPDEECGELPSAFIVRQLGSKITENEIIEFVAGSVSPHKRLRGGVRFVDSVPRNPSGKILRKILRDSIKSKL